MNSLRLYQATVLLDRSLVRDDDGRHPSAGGEDEGGARQAAEAGRGERNESGSGLSTWNSIDIVYKSIVSNLLVIWLRYVSLFHRGPWLIRR